MDRPEPVFLAPPSLEGMDPRARSDAERAYYFVADTNPDRGLVLTDDYNPVEYFDAHNRELVRRRLASAARSW